MFQYQLDHQDCFNVLGHFMEKLGGKVYMILDWDSFFRSSCARQAPRMSELYDKGARIRLMKPQGRISGGWPIMHAKTVVIDKAVVLTGSVNMTHNGHGNNKEHMVSLTDKETVEEFVADFEETWDTLNAITPDMIDRMNEKQIEREKGYRSKSRERSLSRSVSRSLTAELKDAEESQQQQ